jgi:hypothetical protein
MNGRRLNLNLAARISFSNTTPMSCVLSPAVSAVFQHEECVADPRNFKTKTTLSIYQHEECIADPRNFKMKTTLSVFLAHFWWISYLKTVERLFRENSKSPEKLQERDWASFGWLKWSRVSYSCFSLFKQKLSLVFDTARVYLLFPLAETY